MAEVGVAYLSVVPSMKGIKRQLESGIAPAVNSAGDSAGRSLGSRLMSGMKTSAKVAGAGIAGVLGVSLVKGFQRLSAIENAEAKLQGLGNSATDTSKIMDNALAAVKGTAFGMDEAATAAASAVAAGVKPGQELESYLRLVGDAATIAGTDMSSMGAIFGKVMTSGKVQGDVFNQLHDLGIPVVTMLAESMGKSADEIYKMGSAGEISSEEFLKAMGSMSGAALKGGETTTGAFKNLMAALSRFGAGLLKGIYPMIGPIFNKLTGWLDIAAEKVTPLAEAFSVNLFNSLYSVWSILSKGDFTGPIFGLQEDSGLVDFLFKVREGAIGIWNILVRGDFTGPIFGMQEDSGFVDFLFKVREGFGNIWQSLKNLDFSSWDAFKSSMGGTGQAVADMLGSIGDSLVTLKPAFGEFVKQLPALGSAVGQLALGALRLLSETLQFLARHVDTIIKLMPLIVGVFVAWRVATMALTFSSNKLQMAQLAMAPVFLANNVLRLINIRLEDRQTKSRLANAAATSTETGAQAANNAAQSGGILARTRAVISLVAHKVALVATTVATKAATAATWLFSAGLKGIFLALKTGIKSIPVIGWIIAGITALVAALVWFFTKTELGKEIWSNVWNWIKTVTANFVAWFQANVLPAIMNVLNALGTAFQWLYQNVVLPVWNGIKVAVAIAAAVLMTVWQGIVWMVQNVLGPLFTWLYYNVIIPVWNGIKTSVSVVGAALVAIWNGIVWTIQNILAPIFSWLWTSIIVPVWNGIKFAVAVAVAAIMTIWQGIVWTIQNVLAPIFTWLWNMIIIPVWNGIRFAIAIAVAAVMTIWNGIVWTIQNVLAPIFSWLWHGVITPVWNGIAAAISWVWNNVIKVVWAGMKWYLDNVLIPVFWWLINNVVRPVWNAIGSAIKWIWDNVVKPVWDTIKWTIDNILVPVFWFLYRSVKQVWDWISNAIKWVWENIIRPIWDGIKWYIENVTVPAFRWLWDRIKEVWDWIGGHIRDTWNWIKDKILNPMGTFLKEDVVGFFSKAVDLVKEQWDRIKDIVKKPVKFVINTVIRDGFTNNFDKVAEKFDIDPINFKGVGWATGGYTGRGRKYDPAGIVHADEYVIRKESTNRVRGEHGLEALDYLNRTGDLQGAAALGHSHGPGCGCAQGPKGGYGGAGGAAAQLGGGPVPRGIWGPKQRRMSETGRVYINPSTVLGINAEKVAQAWMGRSALDIRVGDGEPNLKFVTGASGPWGYYDAGVAGGTPVQINPAGPQNDRSKQATAIHEIGHALSFAHASSQDSIMYPMISKMMWTGPLDWAALSTVWGRPGEGVKTYGDDGGSGGGGWASALINSLLDKWVRPLFDQIPGAGLMSDVALGGVKNLVDGVVDWVAGKFGGGNDSETPDGGGDVSRWRGKVKEALAHTGLPTSDAYINAWLRQIQTESGGNPNAIQGNIGDINNRTGDIAKGLVQVIGSTFAAYRDKSLPNNRLDPFASLVAGMNYAKARYGVGGMLGMIGHGHGYANGGLVSGLYDNGGLIHKGVQLIEHKGVKPDRVLTDSHWNTAQRSMELAERYVTNRGGDTWNLYGPDPDEVSRRVIEKQRRMEALYA